MRISKTTVQVVLVILSFSLLLTTFGGRLIAGSNQSPTSSFTFSPTYPEPFEPIFFDASSSFDADGWITRYTWNFGDGHTSITTSPRITYSYPIDGRYTVELTVTDNNGATATSSAIVQVSTVVFFRVCNYGSLTPMPRVEVTVYYNDGSGWKKAPVSDCDMEIKYDLYTQPDLANTPSERFRNPGITADILRVNASNIGFDLHPSTWTVCFKFQYGSNVAYWPNDTTTVYTYKNGLVEAHEYLSGHSAYYDPAVGTYVIKVSDIPNQGVSPTQSTPIIVGIQCPPPNRRYLTVKTDPTGVTTIPGEGWYTEGTSATLTAPTYVDISSTTRYRLNYWDVDGTSQGSGVNPINVLMNTNHTATAQYITQYYLIVTSAYGAVGGQAWYDSGSTAYAAVSPLTVSGGSGTQYVFTQWSGDASGSTSPSNSITMNGPKTATANWKTQYYLTVVSARDSPVPVSGWFDSETGITASVTSPVAGSFGTQYVCTGWTGMGSVPGYGSSSMVTFTINTPSSVTWNWKTQYQVIFDQTGVGSDFTSTVVTIDGVNYSRSGLPTTPQFWWDQDSSHSFSYASPLPVNGGENYVWSSTSGLSSLQSGTLTITTSGSVIGNYVMQNRVTFDQTGVGSDFTGTVVIIDGVNYNGSQLPISFPWTSGSFHTFAYQSPLIPSANTKYVWNSTTGLTNLQSGSITVTTYGSIIGNYKTQYYLTVTSAYGLVGGQGWYDSGVSAYATVSPLTVAGPSGTQYVFTQWSGDASGSTSPSNAIVMNGPKTATANWKTQYYLTLATDPSGVDSPSGAGWYDPGASATISIDGFVDIVPGSSRYRFNGWTTAKMSEIEDPSKSPTEVLVDEAKTVTADYVTQYSVYFNQSGIGPDYLGTVLDVDGVNYNLNSLPGPFWWDSGSVHSFAFHSPLTVNGKRYVWISTTGLSTLQSGTLTVTNYGSIVGNYKTQYLLTVVTDPASLSPQPSRDPAGEAGPTDGWWYDTSTSVTLTAPTISGSTFLYWDVNGTSKGIGVNPIAVNMNAHYKAEAHYLILSFTVTISPASASVNVGQPVSFTPGVTGGTSPYTYQWYLDTNPVAGATSSSWTFTPTTSGIYYVNLRVTDTNNNTAQSQTVQVVASAAAVGGYSISLAQQTPLFHMAAYAALMAFLGLMLSVTRRKRK